MALPHRGGHCAYDLSFVWSSVFGEAKAYVRSPSRRNDCSGNPRCFDTVRLRNPRTVCAFQPVASIRAAKVAPPGACSRAIIDAALLPAAAVGVLGLLRVASCGPPAIEYGRSCERF